MIDSGPDEPRRPPVSDLSWVQTEPVRGASPTPPRAGGGWRRHSRWLFPLVALLVGLGIGSAGKSAPDDAATASAPAATTVTSTATVSGPATTVTAPAQTVNAAPKACADALAKAQQVMDYDNQGFAIAGEAMSAAGSFDAAAIEEQTGKLRALTPLKQAAADAYEAAAQKCRDAS
jgi:hypothetical protein